MEVKQIDCNNCGATLNIEPGRTQGFCQFCGTKYVIESKNPKKDVDIVKLYEQAVKAERSRMYDEVVKIYDEILEIDPNFEPALLGKAFSTLTKFKDGVGSIEYFKGLFNQTVEKAEKALKLETVHIMVLDKVWSIKHYLLEVNRKNLRTDPITYTNVFVLVNEIQMFINEYASKVSFENPHDTYKTNYLQLKTDIVDFGKMILNMVKRYSGAPYMWAEKSYAKYLKENIKQAEKDLKIFKKKYGK